jgi:hypothetical protein
MDQPLMLDAAITGQRTRPMSDEMEPVEKPILFSGPMVRALLNGKKTQTRRVLKPQPEFNGTAWHVCSSGGGCFVASESNVGLAAIDYVKYALGNLLWVREAWRASKDYDKYPPREMSPWPVQYEADGAPDKDDDLHMNGRLRPSMFMPQWASRITLEVTGIKVERLQDISEEDAQAEGVHRPILPHWPSRPYASAFRGLWNSINGPESWDANSWVSVITFTVAARKQPTP